MVLTGHYENYQRPGRRRGPYRRGVDPNLARPELIPEMMAELEGALTGKKACPDETQSQLRARVNSLVERIAKGFDYAVRAKEGLPMDLGYQQPGGELGKRFYALAETLHFTRKDGSFVKPPEGTEVKYDTSRETLESYFGVIVAEEAPLKSDIRPSQVLTSLAVLASSDPKTAEQIVLTRADDIIADKNIARVIASSLGIGRQDLDTEGILRFLQLR